MYINFKEVIDGIVTKYLTFAYAAVCYRSIELFYKDLGHGAVTDKVTRAALPANSALPGTTTVTTTTTTTTAT